MKKLVVANWKMNGDIKLIEDFNKAHFSVKTNVVVCPPAYYTTLFKAHTFNLGAQNCSNNTSGAYTGESSPKHLKSLGCKYVILGHSERRSLFKESNDLINKKARTAINCGLTTIICIGESLAERQQNRTQTALLSQIDAVTANLRHENYVIAYEPLWSIGTGLLPSNDDISQVLELIKKRIDEKVSVIYGGSVSSENAKSLAKIPSLNGVLVGGASLNLHTFQHIVNAFQGD